MIRNPVFERNLLAESLCACRSRVLDLSVALYSLYVSRRRSPSFSVLLTASSQLLIKFSQILFYTRYKTLRVDVSAHFENWLKYLAEVCNFVKNFLNISLKVYKTSISFLLLFLK